MTTTTTTTRVLVLGHTGFLGSRLVEHLARDRAHVEIACLSAPDVDLAKPTSVDAVAEHCDAGTTVVFLAGVKRQLGDTLDSFEKNLAIATTVCRGLMKGRIRRVVYVSSAAIYGEERHDLAITEQTPARPTSFYGAGKYATECLLEQTVRGLGETSLAIVRPPLIYGPGDTSNSYGPNAFVKSAISKVPITLWGDGTERRAFLYVGDAARLISALTFSDHAGALNLVSGRSHSYVDVVEEIARALGGTVHTNSRPRTKPKVDHCFSNTAIRGLFPDFRFTPLDEGIRLTLADQGYST